MGDYITLLKAASPANKTFTRSSDGTYEKESAAHHSTYEARVLHVPDVDAIKSILEKVTEDNKSVLILGYVPELCPKEDIDEGSKFYVLSRKQLRKKLGVEYDKDVSGLHKIDGKYYCTRTIDNFTHSTWVMFDYDVTESMPSQFRFESYEPWLSSLVDLFGEFERAGSIILPSSSGRITYKGQQIN